MNVRRRTILHAGLGGAAVLAVPGLVRPARSAGPLRVMHYGGPYTAFKDLIGAPFEKAGLGAVVYSPDQSTPAYAKLEAQPKDPPYDVFMSIRTLSVRMGPSGLLAKLDRAGIPNLAEVVPEAVAPGEIGVAMMLEYLDVMYDKSKVGEPITSWLDLWRPELRGKIALHSSSGVTPLYLIAIAARALGGNERDPKAVDAAFEKYKELKRGVRVFVSDPVQVSTAMDRGEVAVGVQYGLRISALMATNPNIVRATPKEGVPALPLDLVIPRETPNLELAKKYVNFVLSRDIQLAIARGMVATPANRTVPIDADLKAKILSDFGKLVYFDEAYLGTVGEAWLARWQREVQS